MGWYVQLSASGLITGGGFHDHSPDQVTRFRAAIDNADTGAELEDIVAALRKAGFTIGGEQVKTAPRGYPKDDPRLDLLRHKHLTVTRDHGVPSWLPTARVVTKVRSDWQAIRPLITWLSTNVGPSTTPARRR